MADLKHCAKMADSKCRHPIEFLFPEYANDRYTIQGDARSISFFSWVHSTLNNWAYVSIKHYIIYNALPIHTYWYKWMCFENYDIEWHSLHT